MRTGIFSTRSDLLVFVAGPLILTLMVQGFHSLAGLSLTNVSPWVYFFLFVFLDHFHVYLGIGTALSIGTHTPSEQKKFYLLFPPFCLATYIALNFISFDLFAAAFAYVSIFHFARQQLGWMRISYRQETPVWKFERRLNDLCIYASTLGFVAYGASTHVQPQWFSPGDIGRLPDSLAPWILGGIAAINAAFLGMQVYALKMNRRGHGTKMLIWVSTLVVWGLAFGYFTEFNAISLSLIVTHHAVPSMLLSSLYVKKRRGPQNIFLKTLLALAMFAIVFSLLEFGASGFQEESDSFSVMIWLAPLLATASTFHYAIDGFFWREKYNPGCLDF